MKNKSLFAVTFFLLILISAHVHAQIIPANRQIDWSQSGIPGGIPNRTTIFTTIDASVYGNGTTDASQVINTAIAACPADQVVFLPAGTYRLNNAIDFAFLKKVTLRGAGQGKTILWPQNFITSGYVSAITTGGSSKSAERYISSGSTKGSRSIVVNDSSGIQTGMILNIYQDNDPDFYWTRDPVINNHTGQFVMVTAVTGNTVEFEDPLVWDFLPIRNPRFKINNLKPASWCGVEDLTITASTAYTGSMIIFFSAYACWIKNVETAWGNGNDHILMYGNLRCEISECYIHDTYSTTDGYGILTMGGWSGPRGGNTGLRIENNIFSGFRVAIILETEVGSVVAYNYSQNTRYTGWPNYQKNDFNGNHAPHGMMCLFEGNVAASGIQQDGYHGSVSHTTIFRNYFSGQHVDANRTGFIRLIDLCRYSYYQNVVGNVLGNPNWPRNTTGRYEMIGKPSYTDQTVIYRLGYPNMGNNVYSNVNPPSDPNAGGLDPKVKTTLLRWGNYDFQNNDSRWDPDELPVGVPEPTDHLLPPSLYLSAKPSWFGNIPWPAIGPDVVGLTNKIPAQVRFESLPAINSFTANPAVIAQGQSSLLSWTVTNADSLSIDQGLGTVSGTSTIVSPSATTTYTLTATNGNGSSTAIVTVMVQSSGGGGGGGDSGGGGGGCFIAAVQGLNLWLMVLGLVSGWLVWTTRRAKSGER